MWYRELELIIKAKLLKSLKSGNKKLQYDRHAAIMHIISLKIRSFLPIDISIVLMKFGVDIKSKIVICKIVICIILMNLLMYSIIVLGYTIFNYDLACWVSMETLAIDSGELHSGYNC